MVDSVLGERQFCFCKKAFEGVRGFDGHCAQFQCQSGEKETFQDYRAGGRHAFGGLELHAVDYACSCESGSCRVFYHNVLMINLGADYFMRRRLLLYRNFDPQIDASTIISSTFAATSLLLGFHYLLQLPPYSHS